VHATRYNFIYPITHIRFYFIFFPSILLPSVNYISPARPAAAPQETKSLFSLKINATMSLFFSPGSIALTGRSGSRDREWETS
jgi:hypothetical protein